MLDTFKNMGRSVANRVANTTAEVNAKMGQRTPPESRYIVALDIGTEFVKALIGKVTEDHIEITGVGRQHQELSDMQAGAIADIGRVVENCDKALTQAEQQSGVSARSAVIGIAGELVKGTTATVRVVRKQPDKALDLPE